MSNPTPDLQGGLIPRPKAWRRLLEQRLVDLQISTCRIPGVFGTVLESLDSEARVLDLGADDHVAKPAARGKLLSRVRRALHRGQLMKSGH